MRKMRVLIADHDPMFASDLSKEISNQKDMELLGVCSDGQTALSLVNSLNPDLLILDLLLPVVDGFGVIESLCVVGDDSPELLVLSSLTNIDTIRHVNNLSISNFLLKPINIDIIVSRIRDILYGYRISAALHSGTDEVTNPWSAILSCVSRAGVMPHMKGYHYICDAVAYLLDLSDRNVSMTKHIYPAVAAKNKVSPMTIERDIRVAIQKTWKSGLITENDPYFGYTLRTYRGYPTNQEFLHALVAYVCAECNRP